MSKLFQPHEAEYMNREEYGYSFEEPLHGYEAKDWLIEPDYVKPWTNIAAAAPTIYKAIFEI